jgi:hypothetical protein
MADHELHQRRLSRNIGTGLGLAALVVILLGLTMVKLSELEPPPAETEATSP